jgi:hypothetical protein
MTERSTIKQPHLALPELQKSYAASSCNRDAQGSEFEEY